MRRSFALALALALSTGALGCSSSDEGPASGAPAGDASASDASNADEHAAPSIGTVEAFAELPSRTEGVAFGPGPDGTTVLYVGADNHVWRVAPDGTVGEHATVPSPVGIALAADGALLVCGDAELDAGNGPTVIWRVTPTGEASVLVDGGATPFQQTNFVAVAPDGSLVFSDSGANVVYRADADGSNLAVVTRAITFPNGITFSRDAATLYVASWDAKKVWSLPRGADGSYGEPTVFSDDVAYVDGLATFASGDLVYVASADGVSRRGLDGRRTSLATADAFGKLPANGAFGAGAYGEGWLYVTTLSGPKLWRAWVGEGGAPLPAKASP